MMTRVFIPLLTVLAVCAAKPSYDAQLLSKLVERLQHVRGLDESENSVNLHIDSVRLATHLTVMDLVQKCEMYMYTIDIGPLEMAENYFLHRNNSEESILDHACPVVVLVVMEYMATESMEELYAVTDSLLPLMEEAMCVSVVLNRELMEKAAENGQFSMDDRFEKVEQGEQALLDQCMHEFGKGDLVDLTDDLVEKLLLDGDKDK